MYELATAFVEKRLVTIQFFSTFGNKSGNSKSEDDHSQDHSDYNSRGAFNSFDGHPDSAPEWLTLPTVCPWDDPTDDSTVVSCFADAKANPTSVILGGALGWHVLFVLSLMNGIWKVLSLSPLLPPMKTCRHNILSAEPFQCPRNYKNSFRNSLSYLHDRFQWKINGLFHPQT